MIRECRFWTADRYRLALIAAHECWQRDPDGRAAGRPFSPKYLYRHGLRGITTRFRRLHKFHAIVATCPVELRSDWTEKNWWDAQRIDQVLRDEFTRFQHDKRYGEPAGLPWCSSYLKRSRIGRRLLKSLGAAHLPVELFIRRIGGDALNLWVQLRRRWDPEWAREELIRVHAGWSQDVAFGRPAGRPFCVGYLQNQKHQTLLTAIDRNFHGGIHRFVRQIPAVSRDWFYRRSPSNTEVRDRCVNLYRRWSRDPRGRIIGRPFGPTFLTLCGEGSLVVLLRRRGVRKIMRGSRYMRLRADWARRISGMNTPAQKALRRLS